MLRADYREAISQAVSEIKTVPSLDKLGTPAVKQGVVLRLLSAAGWNVFDLFEVRPEYPAAKTTVSFALLSPPPRRSGVEPSPKVFIDVRSPDESLDSVRIQRQLMARCAAEEVPLAVLTNGLRWLLFIWSPEGGHRERQFCEIDLSGDPEAFISEINRYLTRDRVSTGQAARSAERALQDSTRSDQDQRAIIESWRQVAAGLDERLIELVATAAEQRAGYRPDNRMVRRVLNENRPALLATDARGFVPPGTRSGRPRSRPASFTLDSETR